MVVEVYGPQDPYPIDLPTEPEHERIVEAVGSEGGMVACWEWRDATPTPTYSRPHGAWRLRGGVVEPPTPWGWHRGVWGWHEIVSVCMQYGWKLTAYPRGR